MTTRGAQMQAPSSLSIDSTLSTNDSISEASTSSLDYEARLSNARIGGGVIGGAGASGAPSSADREMTEDEVAIMVRNALRKARRAMNNCSPTSGDDDRDVVVADSAEDGASADSCGGGGGNDLDDLRPPSTPDEVDFGFASNDVAGTRDSLPGPSPRAGSSGSRPGGGGTDKSDLARRIEEEIQSARSSAQRRYLGSDEGGGDVTPTVTPTKKKKKPSSASSPTPSSRPASAGDRIARSRDRIAAATEMLARRENNDRPSRSEGAASPVHGGRPSAGPGADDRSTETAAAEGGGGGGGGGGAEGEGESPADPSSRGEGGSDAIAIFGDGPSPPTDNASPRAAGGRASASPGDDGSAPPGDPVEEMHGKSSVAAPGGGGGGGPSRVLAPNVQILHSSNKPPLSSSSQGAAFNPPPPPNTNSTNKPRHHRQVLFRHPYPLPPPPPLPRGDAVIISSHSAPEKDVHVRWVRPDDDLEALIEAAGEEENLIRRSNACGAIKVLASKESNQPKLCRTEGLLDVLVMACWEDAVDSDALDARTRAVSTLLYLAEPKDNRLIVARHPRVLDALIKVAEEDTGEARWRATSTLATLAKTPGNRALMGRSERLGTVLGDLMVVGAEQVAEGGKDDEKNDQENVDAVGNDVSKTSHENREDDGSSLLQGKDSSTRGRSFDTMDDSRMLTHDYSGTGTFTDNSFATHTDDGTYGSVYDSDLDEAESDDELGSYASRDSYDEGSVQEEEGVEMQISSLKKLNIENASDFLAKSQMSACATLLHLTKNCANAPIMCKNTQLLDCIILLAGLPENPLHTRCIEILCNFSRFPSNNSRLASNPKCVNTLLHCGKSKIAEDRMWAIRTIQNMCSDASSKVTLATGALLSVLSTAAMRKDYEEQFAAVGALMNLSTEPGSIVPLTNTKTVVATLVHLAHSPNTPSSVRKIACDSLATIGLWLQTLASAGTVPEEIPFSPLPTHSAMGWLRWETA